MSREDVLNAAMLLGLLGVALPVLIHLLNRRRDPVIDWGAMQFLDLGRRARRKIRLTELLLMLARMALLALVALALARPFWMPRRVWFAYTRRRRAAAADAPPRDVVLVVDGSDSMDRRCGGTTPRDLAVRWARQFVAQLRPGDSVAVLVAGERVRPLIDPPSFDKARIDAVLAALAVTARRGGRATCPPPWSRRFACSSGPAIPTRDVIVLTDGQRSAWRPDEARRWTLVRDLQHRLVCPPRVWALALGAGVPSDAPNGAVGPLVVPRALVTPGLPITVTTDTDQRRTRPPVPHGRAARRRPPGAGLGPGRRADPGGGPCAAFLPHDTARAWPSRRSPSGSSAATTPCPATTSRRPPSS